MDVVATKIYNIMVKITDDQTGAFCVEVFNINNPSQDRASGTYETLKDAYKVYDKVVGWITFGFYGKEPIYEYVQTGTMN